MQNRKIVNPEKLVAFRNNYNDAFPFSSSIRHRLAKLTLK